MRIGIIGGGLMGIALAYFLSQDEPDVTVLEQSLTLGGLNSEIRLEDGFSIPRYHHNILPADTAVRALCEELGLAGDLVFFPARTGFLHGGHIHSMTTLWDFLAFNLLRPSDRLRLGATIVQAQRIRDWRPLDRTSVKDWLIRVGGQEAFERIWAPLLEAKFDNDYETVPATYIWTWLNRMSAIRRAPALKGTVGHLRRGHMSMIQAMADVLLARGSQILLETRVREIEVEVGQVCRVRTNSGILDFDVLIAAVPTPSFVRLLLDGDEAYRARLESSRYLGLVCPALVLTRPLSGYWTLNVTDPSSPFSSIVEFQHPQDPHYTVVYLPKYTAPENDWLGVSDDDIRDAWMMRLRQIFPDLKTSEIRYFGVNRTRFVEPIHRIHAADHLIPVQTPYKGLYLANTSQVYPGLPTSENTVRHAQAVAALILEQNTPQARSNVA